VFASCEVNCIWCHTNNALPFTPPPLRARAHALTLQVLGGFEGPSVEFVVDPVECPIYQDPETGRSYVSFEDCSSATLTITVSPCKSLAPLNLQQ
jgi:hypothetical protein